MNSECEHLPLPNYRTGDKFLIFDRKAKSYLSKNWVHLQTVTECLKGNGNANLMEDVAPIISSIVAELLSF